MVRVEGFSLFVFRRKDLCDAKHDAGVRSFLSKNSVLPQNVNVLCVCVCGGGSNSVFEGGG